MSTSLFLAIALILSSFAPHEASAQTVAMPVVNSGGMPVTGNAGGAARFYRPGTQGPSRILTLSPSLIPSLMAAPAPAISHGVEVQASPAELGALSLKAAAPEVVPGAKVLPGIVIAAPQTEADGQAGSMNLLRESSPVRSDERTAVETSRLDLERLFDGRTRGRSMNETGVPAVRTSGLPLMSPESGLGKPTAEGAPEAGAKTLSPAKKSQTPRPGKHAKPAGLSNAAIAILAAAVIIAVPILAAALGASMSTLALVQPIATVFATTAGAVYGLVTSLRKEGGPASTGEIISAVVRYGILAGAGMYLLLDLSQVMLLGKVASSISPLPAALATATLGQSAFQGKFADAETSSADRIMGVFPAVAAALGLAVTARLPAVLIMTLAVHAMAVTGLAAALFAALYRPGVSQAKGQASMARGFVLQSLMSGLALAVANPYLSTAFLALGAWGFAEVLYTTVRELYSRLPASLTGTDAAPSSTSYAARSER